MRWPLGADEWIKRQLPVQSKELLLYRLNYEFGTFFTRAAFTTHLCEHGIHLNLKPWQNGTGTFGGRAPRPVGSEQFKKGYIRVKVAMPNKWKLKGVYVWETAHGETLDNRHECVIFLDGNNRNFEPSNLEKIPRTIMAVLNNLRSPGDTAEDVKIKIALAELKHAKHEAARRQGLCYERDYKHGGRAIKSDAVARARKYNQRPEIKKKRRDRRREYMRRLKIEEPAKYEDILQKHREYLKRRKNNGKG